MASTIRERRTPPGNQNENVRTYAEEIVGAVYNDVLQRLPTGEEIKEACNPSLIQLDSVIRLYFQLLCSSEFLNRFAFVMSPLLIARMLINQVTGQAPLSAMEIESLAAKLVSSGWTVFIRTLMEEPRAWEHILAEMREVADRRGVFTMDRREESREASAVGVNAAPETAKRPTLHRRRVRAGDFASKATSGSP